MKAYINLYDEYGRSIGAIELFPRIVDYLPAQGQRVGDIVLSLSDMKLYFWDGSTWKGMGVAKLSELIIDVDKDWGGHVIKNLGAPIDSTDAARKAEIDTHETKNTGIHGVGTGYIAKTSRSDQLPSWYDIPDKPTEFPPSAHTHTRSSITDFWSVPFWDNIPDKPFSTLGNEFTVSDGELHLASLSTDVLPIGVCSAFGKLNIHGTSYTDHIVALYAGTVFTDALVATHWGDGLRTHIRRKTDLSGNGYTVESTYSKTAADFYLVRWTNRSPTILASEAVDLSGDFWYIGSMVGSTIKGFRLSSVPTTYVSNPSANVSATDTSHVSGYYGPGYAARLGAINQNPWNYVPSTMAVIINSVLSTRVWSSLPQAQAVIEYHVTGSGTDEDPLRPEMPEELVEVSSADVTPEEWSAVQANPKGPNGLPLANKLAVTWGAFDYKGEPTMICTIYESSSSYLKPGRVLDHIEYAKSKNLAVFKPPRDLSEARDLHAQIRKLKEETIAGVHNLAYQVLGYADLEPLAVADFYEGFVEGIYDAKHIERVPRFDLEKQINRWADKLKLSNVSGIEKAKHMTKLRKFKKQFL